MGDIDSTDRALSRARAFETTFRTGHIVIAVPSFVIAKRSDNPLDPDCRLSRKLGVTVQDAGESGGDLAQLLRLGEQLADTRDERLPSQGRAAVTAHQH